jgi:hypothetical protein
MIEFDLWKNSFRKYSITPEDANLAVIGIAENRKRAFGRGLTVKYSKHDFIPLSQNVFTYF